MAEPVVAGPVVPGQLAPAPGAEPPEGVLAALRAGRLDVTPRGAAGLGVLALVCCALAAVLLLQGRPEQVAAPVLERAGSQVEGAQALTSPGPSTPSAPAEVVVAVAGDVQRPGLVRLPGGSRVADAVAAAGGVLPGAEAGLLNLARVLVDGEQVVVGGAAPQPQPAAPAGAPAAPAGQLDLNQATAADLDALPGIGPVLAERILAHRTEHGPFRSAEQLREVEGIGPATWESLRDLVRV